MGEVFFCQECRQRVDLKNDEYVIPNRSTARTKSQWLYSHAKCFEGRGQDGPLSLPELEDLLGRMLTDRLAGLDADALRQLGLQRIEGRDGGPSSLTGTTP